jgi:acetate kinase
MNILSLNPGGNSLKIEFVQCRAEQRYAFEGRALLSASIEGIGKTAEISTLEGKETVSTEPIMAKDYEQATASFLQWWEKRAHEEQRAPLPDVDAISIRVVHGGGVFEKPALMNEQVREKIIGFEKLAPLHNKSSIEILEPLRRQFPRTAIYAVFDTSFHRTLPEHAFTYALPLDLAKRHHIRRYGFHGISHRYLLERYATLAGKDPDDCTIISTHLESGCSVTAIEKGRSVDNSMGLTPLEGLMMGTRSGDIDPSIVALLMHEEHMSVEDVMTLLNKKSGLQGVSEVSLDTRVLLRKYDTNPRVKLAIDMFVYRVRKAVGAFVAALGPVDAVVFGGGIAENGVMLRKSVCDGLRGFGLDLDDDANDTLIDIEGLLSKPESRLQAWVIPTQEGLQLAHECFLAVHALSTAGEARPV